jgi:hypothetical protein
MSDTVPIACPNCGNGAFKTDAEPKPGNLDGFSCNNCGYAVTQDDIHAQAVKFTEDLVRRGLKFWEILQLRKLRCCASSGAPSNSNLTLHMTCFSRS